MLVYTFGVFQKPLAEEFGWSREAVSSGVRALLLATDGGRHRSHFHSGLRTIQVGPGWINRPRPSLTIFGAAFASLSAAEHLRLCLHLLCHQLLR